MGYRTIIEGALNARLASLTPLMPICWENTDFTPPAPGAAVLPQITLFSFNQRTPAIDDVYAITIDGVDITASGTSLASILQDIAELVVGAVYIASPPGIRVTGTSDGAVFTAASYVVDKDDVPVSGALPDPAITEVQAAYIANAWLTPTFMSGETVQASLGTDGVNKHVGVYQIDVRYPILEGWGPVKSKADDLCTLFKRGTELVSDGVKVTLSRTSVRHGGVENGEWFKAIVTVQYSAYTPND